MKFLIFQTLFNGIYLLFLTLLPLILLCIKDLPIVGLLKREKNKEGLSRYDEFLNQIKLAKRIVWFFFTCAVLNFAFVFKLEQDCYNKSITFLILIISNILINAFTFVKIQKTLDFFVKNADRGGRV